MLNNLSNKKFIEDLNNLMSDELSKRQESSKIILSFLRKHYDENYFPKEKTFSENDVISEMILLIDATIKVEEDEDFVKLYQELFTKI